jgi:hypothetical protein
VRQYRTYCESVSRDTSSKTIHLFNRESKLDIALFYLAVKWPQFLTKLFSSITRALLEISGMYEPFSVAVSFRSGDRGGQHIPPNRKMRRLVKNFPQRFHGNASLRDVSTSLPET